MLNCAGLLLPVIWFHPFIRFTWFPAIIIALVMASYQAFNDIHEKCNKDVLEALRKKEEAEKEALERVEQAEKDSNLWKKSLIEKTSGFPSLIKLIEEYEQTKDVELQAFLKIKSHPAFTSAEVVKEEARRRRFAESESKK